MKIADLFFQAMLDDKRLQLDAKKSGDKAGQTMAKGIGDGIKRLAFTGLAAGFGIATKGLLELENITADFTAETGASADEAKRAGQAINEMAGRNIQPMAEIGRALTKVHTDLGLTGDEAERTAEAFVKFGRATKQDAGEAVVAFDDILDAWGLTAADSQRVMDNLIASHQKYGGSITENQRSLSNLAPQLRALNLDIDDGIALLNVFAASGLDASKAQFALNSAISKLPPGTSMDEFIAHLASIEDPARRAREAIEVFGSRGGAGLANAIRPGMKSLDDFKVSTEEMTGATAEAAAALDNTWGARAQLALKGFTSKLVELGGSFGPVITGFASLASLGGALGLDKLLIGGWKKVAASGAVKSAAATAGAIIGAVYGAAAATTERLTDLIKEGWSELADSAGVKALSARAGSIVGAVYGAALATASKIGELIAAVFRKLPFMGTVRAAVLASAIQLGTLQGTAFAGAAAAAAAAALAAAPLVIPFVLIPMLQSQNLATKNLDLGASLEDLERQLEVAKNAHTGNTFEILHQRQAIIALEKQIAALKAAEAGLTGETDKLGLAFNAVGQDIRDAAPEFQKSAQHIATVVSSSIAQAGPGWEAIARKQARRAAGGIADGIHDKRDAVDWAWDDLLSGIEGKMSVTTETARLLGRLVSKELAESLSSADPELRARAQESKQIWLDRLAELKPRAGTLGKEAMDFLRKGMKSKDPDIRQASTDAFNAATSKIKTLPATAKGYGVAAGKALASGLTSQQVAVEKAAAKLAGAVGNYLKISSPAEKGPWSELGGPQGWGERFGMFLTKGLESSLAGVNATIARSLALPAMPAFSLGSAIALPSVNPAPFRFGAEAGRAGGDTFITNNTANVTGLVKAPDPLSIARQLSRFAVSRDPMDLQRERLR